MFYYFSDSDIVGFVIHNVSEIDFNIMFDHFSEVDYVCFDIMPRHHSVVRYRIGMYFSVLIHCTSRN